MKNYNKLFIHLFTKGMETYGDSRGVFRAIDEVLEKSDDLLWKELKESIEQAKRLSILRENGISMEIFKTIETDIPEDLVQKLIKEVISLQDLKVLMTKEIDKR